MSNHGGLNQQLAAVGQQLAFGSSQLIVIDGEPGTGRTHTLAQVQKMAAAQGLRVATVRAAQDDEAPYAVIEALGDELGAKLCSTELTSSRDIAEVAARLLDAAGASAGLPGSCLLIDDADWSDDASLRVLLHIVRRPRDRSVVLVVATGSGSRSGSTTARLDELRATPGTVLVQLGPLQSDEATRLVEASLGARATEAVRQELLRRSAGNAFLLTALLDDFDRHPGSDHVPDRVRAAVNVRLARLGPEAIAFARAAHVLGPDASIARVAPLADLSRRAAEDAGDALARACVLARGSTVAFVQPLVDDAIGRSIEPFTLDRLHRRAAEQLVAEQAPAVRVVTHLLLTTPAALPWVVEQLQTAATEATSIGDCAVAATLLRRALAEPPAEEARAAVLSELAFAESRAGLPEAAHTLAEALAVVDCPGTRLMLLREQTRLMWLTGRLPEAVAASETALAAAETGTELHDELLAELLAVASMHDLAPIHARPRLLALLDRARTGWVPDSAPLAATLATVLPYVLADHRLVAPLVDRATREDLWRVDATPFGMRPDFVIGSLWITGGLARGIELVHQGMASVDPANLFRHGLLYFWLGEHRYAAGDLSGAIEATGAALEPRWGPFISWLGLATATLAHAHMDLDDDLGAEETLAAADNLDPHQLTGIAVDLARARLLVRSGRPSDALFLTSLIAERLDALGHRNGPQIVWRPVASAAALDVGDTAGASTLIEEEIEWARATNADGRLGRALRARARVVDPDERIGVLRESVEALASSERRLERARSSLALGVALHGAGDTTSARTVLGEARELAEACGAGPLANEALLALHATGARPRRTALKGVDSLTGTERRIVELAALGQTNRAIAQQLTIAPRTVEWHLTHAFTKLGVRSRRDLAAAIARRPDSRQ